MNRKEKTFVALFAVGLVLLLLNILLSYYWYAEGSSLLWVSLTGMPVNLATMYMAYDSYRIEQWLKTRR